MIGVVLEFLVEYFYGRFYRAFFRVTKSRPVAMGLAGFCALLIFCVMMMGLFMVLKVAFPPKPIA